MSENNEMLSIGAQLVGMPLAGPESFSQQQLDYLKRALGVDETVLFENSSTGQSGSHSVTLSEALTNFSRAMFVVSDDSSPVNKGVIVMDMSVNPANGSCLLYWSAGYRMAFVSTSDSITWTINGYQWWGDGGGTMGTQYLSINKVVGIHRIAGGNQ